MRFYLSKIAIYTFVFLIISTKSSVYCADNKENINRHLLPNQHKLELLLKQSKSEINTITDSSIKLSELGLKLAIQFKETEYQIKFLNILLNCYNKLYDNKSYEYYSLQLIEILQKERKYKELSSVYLNFSAFYGKISNYNKSFIYTNKLIELAKKTADTLMLAKSYSNLGTILLALKDNENAIIYLKKGLKLIEYNNGNTSLKVSINNNIAIVLGNQKLFDESLAYQLTSLKLLENTQNYRQLGLTQLNIGYTFSELKKYQNALIFFNKALTNALKSEDKFLVASIYKNLGECNLVLKNYTIAYKYLRKAESIALETHNIITLADSYEILSNYSFINKDFKQAFIYYEKFQKLNDSLFVSKNNKNVSELKVNFETTEKEKENQVLKQKEYIKQIHIQNQKNVTNLFRLISVLCIVIVAFVIHRFILKKKANKNLSIKNELITIQNQKLEEVNKAKDKFFSIIAKDIKEPYFVIKENIDKLSSCSDNLSNEQLFEIAESIKQNSIIASKLLENLLIWAKVQRGIIEIKTVKIHLKTCVYESIKNFVDLAEQKQHKINIDVSEDHYIFADKYTIEFVIGSIFNNSVKFTPNNGVINVRSELSNDLMRIIISDNGIGISTVRLEKLFNIGEDNTTLTSEKMKGSGLGLHICKEFIKINKGEISLKSTQNKGTVATIQLSIASC